LRQPPNKSVKHELYHHISNQEKLSCTAPEDSGTHCRQVSTFAHCVHPDKDNGEGVSSHICLIHAHLFPSHCRERFLSAHLSIRGCATSGAECLIPTSAPHKQIIKCTTCSIMFGRSSRVKACLNRHLGVREHEWGGTLRQC
jgi:hypothetical protein